MVNQKQKHSDIWYTVFSAELATYLIKNDIMLATAEPDKSNPRRNVFIFAKTPRLLELVQEYTEQRRKDRG